jgi:serine/threonine protein kinase/WD40 repeat protein
VPVSIHEFVERLSQSGILSGQEVQAYLASLPASERPKDGEALAARLVQAGKLTRYQAAAIAQGKAKNLAFDEYVILDKIGQGGMGVVLKAQHRRLKRPVAIKIIAPASMKSPDAVRRFYREVEAAGKLNHPNIVAATDAREFAGSHCLVMEFVDGQDLASIVKEHGPLPVRQAVDCIVQAARGLHYAHQQGIVHRDIKPANLLLDRNGTVKILDMGLARVAGLGDEGEGDRLTQSGQVMGTCDYMAPEQSLDTHKADHRADVYSLGCTLYRLLTGKTPYAGDSYAKLFMAHMNAPIPSLCAARADVPAELDAAFARMVAKQPEGRQQSMAEVISELEASLGLRGGRGDEDSLGSNAFAFLREVTQGATTGTRQKVEPQLAQTSPSHAPREETDSFRLRLDDAAKRLRISPAVLAVGGLAAAVVVVAGIIITIRSAGGKKTTVQVHDGSQVTVSNTGQVDVTLPTALDSAGGQPDNITAAEKRWGVKRKDAAAIEPPKGGFDPALAGGDFCKPMSPRAFVQLPAKLPGLRSWTIDTRRPRGKPLHKVFSADGKRLITYGSDGTLRAWDVATGALQTAASGYGRAEVAALSPDGTRLAVAWGQWDWDGKFGLEVRDAATFRSLNLKPHFWTTSLLWSPDGQRLVAVRNVGSAWDLVVFGDNGRQELKKKSIPRESAMRIGWLADGSLYFGAGKPPITIVDGNTLETIRTLDFANPEASPDGRLLAAQRDGEPLVLDASTAKVVAKLGRAARDGCWSPDGSRLAVTQSRAGLQFYRLPEGKLDRQYPDLTGDPAWSRDGRRVATGHAHTDIVLLEGEQLTPRTLLLACWIGGWPELSHRGTQLAVGSVHNGRGPQLIDVATAATLQLSPEKDLGSPAAMAFSVDDRLLATAHSDKRLYWWDTRTGAEVGALGNLPAKPRAVAFSPDASALAVALDDATIAVYGLADRRQRLLVRGLEQPAESIAWSADGRQLKTGEEDRLSQAWDAASGKPTGRIDEPGLPGPTEHVALHRLNVEFPEAVLTDPRTGRYLKTLVPMDEEHWAAIGVDGRCQSPHPMDQGLICLAETDDGQHVVFTPQEFAARFGWNIGAGATPTR